jgi:hypothetical protein
VPTDGRPVPLQGSTLAVIDLTVDDPRSDKGKRKADVEMVDAPDWPGTSVAPEDDMVEESAKWGGVLYFLAPKCLRRGYKL